MLFQAAPPEAARALESAAMPDAADTCAATTPPPAEAGCSTTANRLKAMIRAKSFMPPSRE